MTPRRLDRIFNQCGMLVLAVGALVWHVAVAAEVVEPAADGGGAVQTVLILPFDMVDTSLQGEMNHGPLNEDVARLRGTQDVFRKQVEQLGPFRVMRVPDRVKPAIKDAEQTYRYLYRCNGCELDIGKQAGADLVLTGWVQKVSNLILNFNAVVRDVQTGREVAGGSVDMRGNTDDSWRHAAVYFVKHTLIDSYRSRRQPAGADNTSSQ